MKRQVTGIVDDAMAYPAEEIFTNVIHMVTDSLASEKKSTLDGLIDVSISQIIESGQKNYYLDTWLSSHSDLTMFMSFAICRIMTEKSLITLVTQFIKNAAHEQVLVATVQPAFRTPSVNRTTTAKWSQ